MTKSNDANASTKQSDKHFDAIEQGAHDAGKDDSATSTLRKDNLPKPEKVVEIDADKNAGKTIECAEKQNKMSPDGQLAQLPSGRDHKSTTGSGN